MSILKRTRETVDQEYLEVLLNKLNVINNFDFSKEEPMHIDSNQWKNQNIMFARMYMMPVIINKKSNVVITQEDKKIIGVLNKTSKKCIRVEELSNTVKKWIYDSGITIDYTPKLQ